MNRQLMTPHSASLANANVNDSHFKKSKISSQQFTVIFSFSNFYLEGKKKRANVAVCRLSLLLLLLRGNVVLTAAGEMWVVCVCLRGGGGEIRADVSRSHTAATATAVPLCCSDADAAAADAIGGGCCCRDAFQNESRGAPALKQTHERTNERKRC